MVKIVWGGLKPESKSREGENNDLFCIFFKG